MFEAWDRRRNASACIRVLAALASIAVAEFGNPSATAARAADGLRGRTTTTATAVGGVRATSFDELDGLQSPEGVVADPTGDGLVFAGDGACPCGESPAVCGQCRLPCRGHCDPPGLIQRFADHHRESGACWVGRADGLLLWRDAPPSRPLIVTGDGTGLPLLDANQLNSTATGGVRGTLLRVDGCSGDAWELGYLYAGNFTSRRGLPLQPGDPAYALADPGIYGVNASQPFSSGTIALNARLQSAEINRHLAVGPNLRWLAGFRWIQWQEQFTLVDRLDDGVRLVDDIYETNCDNNLFGGQIGADAKLLTLSWLRIDSVVKAGAYYNAAEQASAYTTINSTLPGQSGAALVSVVQSPAACSFVGEVGVTGVIPLSQNLDFRFGYLGLWLTGLAQPTQQLSNQQLVPGTAAVGSLAANGGTLVQGLTLGLEGRW